MRVTVRSMDRTLKTRGGKHSGSAAVALPGRKLATSKTPRMLTPSEVALLRQDLKVALSYPMPQASAVRSAARRKAVKTVSFHGLSPRKGPNLHFAERDSKWEIWWEIRGFQGI